MSGVWKDIANLLLGAIALAVTANLFMGEAHRRRRTLIEEADLLGKLPSDLEATHELREYLEDEIAVYVAVARKRTEKSARTQAYTWAIVGSVLAFSIAVVLSRGDTDFIPPESLSDRLVVILGAASYICWVIAMMRFRASWRERLRTELRRM